jgi:sugar phosphate isomerase/epimerase
MIARQQFGFNAFWWGNLHTPESIQSCVNTLAEIGYRAVEFKIDSFDQKSSIPRQFSEAVDIAKKAGLSVSNFVILRDLIDPDQRTNSIADICNCIRAVAQADVDKLNLVSGAPVTETINEKSWWLPQKRPALSQSWDNLVDSLEQILQAADREGVSLALEPCTGNLVQDYGTTQELFRRIQHVRLCLTFDPSHFLLHRDDIGMAVREFGKKVIHVHVKDAVGRPGEFGVDFVFPILGEGGVDWTGFFQALDDIGYKGALSCEFESFKYMDEVLNNKPEEAAKICWKSLVEITQKYQGVKTQK